MPDAAPRMVPELEVTDLAASLDFYVRRAGFTVDYERPAEGFAYLSLGSAHLMLEAIDRSARRFTTAPLERPFGRGMNLQIEVDAAAALLARIAPTADELVLALEDRWYDTATGRLGNRQFVVADPDGYLLRFFSNLE